MKERNNELVMIDNILYQVYHHSLRPYIICERGFFSDWTPNQQRWGVMRMNLPFIIIHWLFALLTKLASFSPISFRAPVIWTLSCLFVAHLVPITSTLVHTVVSECTVDTFLWESRKLISWNNEFIYVC